MRMRCLLPGDEGAAHVRSGELLDGDAQADVVATLAAEFGFSDDPQDAGPGHLANGVARQMTLLVPATAVGPQLMTCEIPDMRAPCFLFRRKGEVEGHRLFLVFIIRCSI